MNSTGDGDLQRLAELIRARNATKVEITSIIHRPAQIGHIGEYIASIFLSIKIWTRDPVLDLSASTGVENSSVLDGR